MVFLENLFNCISFVYYIFSRLIVSESQTHHYDAERMCLLCMSMSLSTEWKVIWHPQCFLLEHYFSALSHTAEPFTAGPKYTSQVRSDRVTESMQDANHTICLTDCNDILNCWNKDCADLNILSEQPLRLIECWKRQMLLNLTAKIDGFQAPQHYIMWVCSITEMVFTLRRGPKHLWKMAVLKRNFRWFAGFLLQLHQSWNKNIWLSREGKPPSIANQ